MLLRCVRERFATRELIDHEQPAVGRGIANALQNISIQTGNLYGDGVELRAFGGSALHEVVDADPALIDFGAIGIAGFLFQNHQIRPNESDLRQAVRADAWPRDADARVELFFGKFDERRDRDVRLR